MCTRIDYGHIKQSKQHPELKTERRDPMNKCQQCKKRCKNKFCNVLCKSTWHNRNRTLPPNVDYKCEVCERRVQKYVSPSRIASGYDTLQFCSRKCAGIGRRGKRHHQWKGGTHIDKDGYIMVLRRDHPHANSKGCVRQHRLFMEEHLGRLLRPNEVVHHINDNPADNRIENLKLYESNKEHKRDDNEHRERDDAGRYIAKRKRSAKK